MSSETPKPETAPGILQLLQARWAARAAGYHVDLTETDLSLARRAVQRGWITDAALENTLAEWRARHPDDSVGLPAMLLAEGLLTPAQIGELRAEANREPGADPATPAPAAAKNDSASVLGPFVLLDVLGSGAMGTVYRARHVGLDRVLALKVFKLESNEQAEALERFQREARILARLDHPGIVRVSDVGESGGKHYIAMELVEGEDLSHYLARGRPPLQTAIRMMASIARAVGHVHAEGCIHRDLKPGNILLDANGQPRVSDFGLGRDTLQQTSLTQTHQVMGTPHYMAPENFETRSRRELGPAADVFSMGVIFYELLTGRRPFEQETALALFRSITEDDPIPPTRLQADIPPPAEAVCLKALRKEPAQRYADGNELADDLTRLLCFEAVCARPETTLSRLRRRIGRNPALALVGSLAAVLVLALTMAWAWTEHDRRRAATLRRAEMLDSGRAALAGGRLDEALRTFTQARGMFGNDRDLDTGRHEALLALGDKALASHEADLAAYFFNEVWSENADDPRALAGIDRVEFMRGERRRAMKAAVQKVCDAVDATLARKQRPTDESLLGWALDLVSMRGDDLVDEMLGRETTGNILREVFARAYGHLGDGRARGLLIDWLQLPESDVFLKLACCQALSRLGGDEAREAVTRAYFSFPELQGRIDDALGRLAIDEPAKDADTTPALVDRGMRQAAAGRAKEAIAAYTRALELDPRSTDALNNRGNIYRDSGRLEEALADFGKALAIRPSAMVLNNRALTLDLMGRKQEALADLDAAIALEPLSVDAVVNRGNIYRDLGRNEDALRDYEMVLGLSPEFAGGWHNRGNLLFALGRYEEAVKDFDTAIKLDGKMASAYAGRASTHMVMGETEKALADHASVIRLQPRNPSAYLNRGVVFRQLDRLREAMDDFEEALRIAPEHAGARNNRGGLLREQGKTLDALADFDAAIRLEPGNASFHHNRALACRDLGRTAEALRSFSEAIRLEPRFADAHFSRGNLYREKEQTERALADYNRAIEIQPDHAGALNNRAIVHLAMNRPDKAMADVDEALRHKPEFAQAYLTRAMLHERKQDLERAIADVRQFLSLRPDDPGATRARAYLASLQARWEAEKR